MEQTLNKILFGAAALAAMSLSACVDGGYSKSQPRPGYDLAFAPDAITSDAVECAMLDAQLATAVPGCRDSSPITDQQTYDTAKLDETETWMSRVPVSCGWLRPESATVAAFPACYVWVKRIDPGRKDGLPAAPTPAPAPSSEQSTSNSTDNTSTSASITSGPEGDQNSAESETEGVSTSASTSTTPEGTGTFSVDNGHTSMSGTFAADGSVSSVSFGESGGGVSANNGGANSK